MQALLRLAEAADAAPSLRTSAQFGAACVRDCEVLCSDGGHVALALGALAELLAAAARAVRASARQETRSGGGGVRNGGGGNGSESRSESRGGASAGAAASKAALQHAQRKVAFLQVSRPHPAVAITAPSSDHPPLPRRRRSDPGLKFAHYHPCRHGGRRSRTKSVTPRAPSSSLRCAASWRGARRCAARRRAVAARAVGDWAPRARRAWARPYLVRRAGSSRSFEGCSADKSTLGAYGYLKIDLYQIRYDQMVGCHHVTDTIAASRFPEQIFPGLPPCVHRIGEVAARRSNEDVKESNATLAQP